MISHDRVTLLGPCNFFDFNECSVLGGCMGRSAGGVLVDSELSVTLQQNDGPPFEEALT